MPDNPFIWNFRGRRSVRLKGQDYSEPGFYAVTICAEGRKCLFGSVQNNKMLLNIQGIMVMQWWMELIYRYPQVSLNASVIMPNHLHGILELTEPEDPDPDRSLLSRVLPEDIADAHPHRAEILNWLKDPSWVGAVATKDRVGMIKGDIALCVGAGPRARPDGPTPDRGGSPYDRTGMINRSIASCVGADLCVRPDREFAAVHQINQPPWSSHVGNISPVASKRNPDINRRGGHAGPPLPTLGSVVQWVKTMSTNGYINGVKQHGWHPFDKRLWQRSFYDSVLWTGRDIENMQDYIIQNTENWAKDPLFVV